MHSKVSEYVNHKIVFTYSFLSFLVVFLSKLPLIYQFAKSGKYIYPDSFFSNSAFSLLVFLKKILPEYLFYSIDLFVFAIPLILSFFTILSIIYIGAVYNNYFLGISVALYLHLVTSYYSVGYLGNISLVSLLFLLFFASLLFLILFMKMKNILYFLILFLLASIFVFVCTMIIGDIISKGSILFDVKIEILDLLIFFIFLVGLYFANRYALDRVYFVLWLFCMSLVYFMSIYKLVIYNSNIVNNAVYTKEKIQALQTFSKTDNNIIIGSSRHANAMTNYLRKSNSNIFRSDKNDLEFAKILLSRPSYNSSFFDAKKNSYVLVDDEIFNNIESKLKLFNMSSKFLSVYKIDKIQDTNQLYTKSKTHKIYFAHPLTLDLKSGKVNISTFKSLRVNTIFLNDENKISKIVYEANENNNYSLIVYKDKYIILAHHLLFDSFFIQSYLLNSVDSNFFTLAKSYSNFKIYKKVFN